VGGGVDWGRGLKKKVDSVNREGDLLKAPKEGKSRGDHENFSAMKQGRKKRGSS